MVRIGVSIDKKDLEKLRKISIDEKRPLSNQIVYMLEFYLKFKDKVK